MNSLEIKDYGLESYREFLRNKVSVAPKYGFEITTDDVHPYLKEHQKLSVVWAVGGGRRALFESYGLGKTLMQLEIIRIILSFVGGMGLIVMPLGVRAEFMRDAQKIGLTLKFIRRPEEIDDPHGIYITNYETIRDGKLDPRLFSCASLDECAVLRSAGGSATFRECMATLAGDRKTLNDRIATDEVQYRFIATACPSPNSYEELLAYAAYLGIQDISASKTKYFKRDSTKADNLTLLPSRAEAFFTWLSTWALFVQKPSDIGCDDTGYDLPEMRVHWHQVSTDHSNAGVEKSGQARMFCNASLGVVESSREKRNSIDTRLHEIKSIIETIPESEQIIIWAELNDEQKSIEGLLRDMGITFSSLYGSQDIEKREVMMNEWRDKKTRVFLSKLKMYSSGVNLQQAHYMIYAGIGFKFHDVHQGFHRILRFGQLYECHVHFVYTQAERNVRKVLERKWKEFEELRVKMTEIIKEFGLSISAMSQHLTRAMGVERVEISGERYRLINNDCVIETKSMEENSVGLILTSIPFSTQYEYSPNFADFGHSDNNAQFWAQMDYLIPELFRVLQPGRIAAIHVKDRIVPGGMTGLGFQTVYPFHKDCIDHFTTCPECRIPSREPVPDGKGGVTLKWVQKQCSHMFGYMGMKTIVTDVVRENNQTYRLGWTEQCKDGTKMGVGMPEYLLLFRKPPTDTANSYADVPVVKTKDKYSRSRWQIDAHGFTRSSGDRLMDSEELKNLKHDQIFKMFRDYSLTGVYDFEHHVKIGEHMDLQGRLPVTFMLLQPQSWSPYVWTDITRMLTLNGAQSAKGKELHLCPMQTDLADRVIEQMSNPGDVVYDPFDGVGTVPYRSILKGRYGLGCELARGYFLDSATYCKMAENKMATPTLFTMIQAAKAEQQAKSV